MVLDETVSDPDALDASTFEPLSAAKKGPTLRITSPLQPDAPTRVRMTIKN